VSDGFCLAHLTDPHLTRPFPDHWRQLANKRLLGLLSWHLRRRHEHRPEVLAALTADLRRRRPDHTVVTGDLTQLGLPGECEQAAAWLEELGTPENVSVIPGNHDRYVAENQSTTLGRWQPYFHLAPGQPFPFVHPCGPLALIGLDSAPPSPPLRATGTLGRHQCRRLGELLEQYSDRCRVVLLHHPPHREAVTARKRLTDSEHLVRLLARHGCGLVLHGHSHRWQLHWLSGPRTPIPVVGLPSASARGKRRGYRARYHLYHFRRRSLGWEVTVEIRGLEPDAGRFRLEGEWRVTVAG